MVLPFFLFLYMKQQQQHWYFRNIIEAISGSNSIAINFTIIFWISTREKQSDKIAAKMLSPAAATTFFFDKNMSNSARKTTHKTNVVIAAITSDDG